MAIITLTTDFGLTDNFVGVMKGVILSIAKDAVVVDLTHNVTPQDIHQAAFVLLTGFSYFPSSTVHVCVVDPGVGSGRRILAVKALDHFFVAPDNGVLSYVLDRAGSFDCWSVENPDYMLPEVSQTFHGRDIMAPTAAWILKGVEPKALGLWIDDPIRLPEITARKTAGKIEGRVIYADRFGNLITNVAANDVPDEAEIHIGEECIVGLKPSYNSTAPGALLAVKGSHGFLEIARNRESARDLFPDTGALVTVAVNRPN
jgi:S-adenosylmethionine hydrolase